jgi:hypothetical protein
VNVEEEASSRKEAQEVQTNMISMYGTWTYALGKGLMHDRNLPRETRGISIRKASSRNTQMVKGSMDEGQQENVVLLPLR